MPNPAREQFNTDYDNDIPAVVTDTDEKVDIMKGLLKDEIRSLLQEGDFSKEQIAGALVEIDSIEKLLSPKLSFIARVVGNILYVTITQNSANISGAKKAYEEIREEHLIAYTPRIPNINQSREETETQELIKQTKGTLFRLLY